MEERFEKIDSKMVVRELKKAKKNSEKLHPELKKMIKHPEFPQKIRLMFVT